jgi:hypothetical protein
VVAAAALQSADGAFLLGQMAPFTSAAGEWVFPCGTPEADDINAAGMLGLFGNLARDCSKRLASTSLLATSSQAGRWCATAGSSP